MTKKNPVYIRRGLFSLPSNFRAMPKAKKQKVKRENYADRVKALRKLNKGFDAKDGYNLRDIKAGRIPSAKLAKINRYIKGQAAELAAINTGRAASVRARRPDNLKALIEDSQQQTAGKPEGKYKTFPGQKFAVYVTDFPEEFKVETRRVKTGLRIKTRLKRSQIDRRQFKEIAPNDWQVRLADDPSFLVRELLEYFPSKFKRFRLMTGKYQSDRSYTRKELPGALAAIILSYADEDGGIDPGEVGGWLTGIVGFE